MQVTEIDSLIGEPAVWQDRASGNEASTEAATKDGKSVMAAAVTDAETQTDDVLDRNSLKEHAADQEQGLQDWLVTCYAPITISWDCVPSFDKCHKLSHQTSKSFLKSLKRKSTF